MCNRLETLARRAAVLLRAECPRLSYAAVPATYLEFATAEPSEFLPRPRDSLGLRPKRRDRRRWPRLVDDPAAAFARLGATSTFVPAIDVPSSLGASSQTDAATVRPSVSRREYNHCGHQSRKERRASH